VACADATTNIEAARAVAAAATAAAADGPGD